MKSWEKQDFFLLNFSSSQAYVKYWILAYILLSDLSNINISLKTPKSELLTLLYVKLTSNKHLENEWLFKQSLF